MIIKSLELKDFRNYQNLKIDFSKDTNILYGDNAQGKTNVLEALYLSSTSRSHKGSRDREMIRFGAEEAHIRTVLCKNGRDYQIDMHLKKNNTRGIAIDRIPIRKASDLFGIMNTVFFSPEDLNIIKMGPSERRRFLDMELSQLDRIYLADLSDYHKVLKQRNKLLKELEDHPEWMETLQVWNSQLVSAGKRVIRQRRVFLRTLDDITSEIHSELTGGKEELKLSYEPDVTEDYFEEKLFLQEDKDRFQKTTTVGPHRDDIKFQINGIDIRKFGSQGQQRTAALSLKLAEIELVRKTVQDTPILLLDDVLSELDSNRQTDLLNHIHDVQTVITCTGLEEFVKMRFPVDRVFYVRKGTIREETGKTETEETI